jgi:hypothetical protein
MSDGDVTHEIAHLLRGSDQLGVLAGEGNSIRHASDSARVMLGLEKGELETIDWVGMTPPEYRLADDEAIRRTIASGSSRWYTKQFELPDGARITVEVLAIALTADPFRWIALIRQPEHAAVGHRLDDSERAAALLTMARRLAGARGLGDVFDIVDRMGATALGAAYLSVALLDRESERLLIHHDPGLDADVRQRWTDVPLDGRTLLGDAAVQQQALVCWSVDELRSRYPTQGANAERLGLEAFAAVPMRSDHGKVVGVVGFAWRSGADADLDQAGVVADVVANAIELGQVGDRQRSIETTFQEMLLPPPEAVSTQLEVAVRYRGYDESPGGDFYDVIDTDAGVWFVVGDVVGHGIGAARTMGKTRFFVRALSRSLDPDPGELLDRVSALLCREHQNEMATCLAVRWDLASSTLEIASAGHPPRVIVTGGDCMLVEVKPGSPLGMGDAATPVIRIPCPDRLVLYSDGLVERRGEPLHSSFDRLVAAVRQDPRRDVEALADDLLAMVDDVRTDDVAIVCADLIGPVQASAPP